MGKVRMEFRAKAVESIGLKKYLMGQLRGFLLYVNDLSML